MCKQWKIWKSSKTDFCFLQGKKGINYYFTIILNLQETQPTNNLFKNVIALFNHWSNLNYYKNGDEELLNTTDSDTKIKLQIFIYVII